MSTPLPFGRDEDGHVPAPVLDLLLRAELAVPEGAVHQVRIDAQTAASTTKTVLAFHAALPTLNRLVVLSPGLCRADVSIVTGPASEDPSFPWWSPYADGELRRFAYDTAAFEFVEVFIGGKLPTLHLRAFGQSLKTKPTPPKIRSARRA